MDEDDDRTLYISNLDKNVTEEILYELFLQAGPIERVIISSRNSFNRYGLVIYKHECSIDYAIDLYKGTRLFRKEIMIKKKTQVNLEPEPRLDQGGGGGGIIDFQSQLLALQLLAQNLNNHPQPPVVNNFSLKSLQGNWSSRNRPYDYGRKNNYSRSSEMRGRRTKREHSSKMNHHRRNHRHRN